MHDFTLLNISIEWASGIAKVVLLNNESSEIFIHMDGLILAKVPRLNEWGKSISVNKVIGVTQTSCGNMKLDIEMQSGDVIELVAEKISLPY